MEPNQQLSELMENLREHRVALVEDGSSEAVTSYDFHRALGVANGVMEQYKLDQPKWWKRMDGTPILNDLPVIMAMAFQAECEALEKRAIEAEELNRKFMGSVNSPTHIGEPIKGSQKAPVTMEDLAHALSLFPDGTPAEERLKTLFPEKFDATHAAQQQAEPGADERAVATPFLTTQVEGDPDPAKQRFRMVAEYRSLEDMYQGHDLFVAAVKAAQSGQRAGVARPRRDQEAAYHSIDRFLRNNLCDEDYAEYSAELDSLLAAAPTQQQEGGKE